MHILFYVCMWVSVCNYYTTTCVYDLWKERTEELQKYVEILKAEKQQLELMGRASRDSFSSLLGSPAGSIRRVCLHTLYTIS